MKYLLRQVMKSPRAQNEITSWTACGQQINEITSKTACGQQTNEITSNEITSWTVHTRHPLNTLWLCGTPLISWGFGIPNFERETP